jgi:hypothetical protein
VQYTRNGDCVKTNTHIGAYKVRLPGGGKGEASLFLLYMELKPLLAEQLLESAVACLSQSTKAYTDMRGRGNTVTVLCAELEAEKGLINQIHAELVTKAPHPLSARVCAQLVRPRSR